MVGSRRRGGGSVGGEMGGRGRQLVGGRSEGWGDGVFGLGCMGIDMWASMSRRYLLDF